MASFLNSIGKKPKAKADLTDSSSAAFSVVLNILTAFEEMDSKGSERTQKAISLSKRLSFMNNSTKQEISDLASANRGFVFYLLNLSPDEFYECYKVFFRQFDQDDSLVIEKNEFYSLVDYLAKPENMGKEKIVTSFKMLDRDKYDSYAKLALTNNSTKIDQNLKQAIFDSISMKVSSGITQNECVNYPKFLPMIISYFTDFIRKRINTRLINMEIICGIDSELVELPRNMNSLYSKFKMLGLNLKKGSDPPVVAFKDFEKVLILFRSSYAETFTNEQLMLVMTELRKKLHVDSEDIGRDKNPIILDYKLLIWISYRLCMHCALFNLLKRHKNDDSGAVNAPKHVILEEYTLWACAFNLKHFQETALEQKFLKYAKKHIKIDFTANPLTTEMQSLLKDHFKKFLRKVFPHLSPNSINNLLTAFNTKYSEIESPSNYIEQLATSLEQLLIQEATSKLNSIIATIHKAVRNNEVMKKILNKKESDLKALSKTLEHDGNNIEPLKLNLAKLPSHQNGHMSQKEQNSFVLTENGSNSKRAQHVDLSGREESITAQTGHARKNNRDKLNKSKISEENGMEDRKIELLLSVANHKLDRDPRFNHQESEKMEQNSQRNSGSLSAERIKSKAAANERILSRISDDCDDFPETRFSRNRSTGRQPDILNSFFILGSFLEKYNYLRTDPKEKQKLLGEQQKQLEEKELIPEPKLEESFNSNLSSVKEDHNSSRNISKIAQKSNIVADQSPSMSVKQKELSFESQKVPKSKIKVDYMNSKQQQKSGVMQLDASTPLMKLSANNKLINSYITQALSDPEKKPSFNFSGLDFEEDMDIDEIQFSRIKGTTPRNPTSRVFTDPQIVPQKRDGRVCACTSCVIF